VAERFYVRTLGCPKNEVDTAKLTGSMLAAGLEQAPDLSSADLVVVNTCAFIDAARAESVEAILDAATEKRRDARLVVTGCLAARAGEQLARELPEVDAVVDFGVPVHLGSGPRWRRRSDARPDPAMDLLELPRPKPDSPWAYVKVAEGCDRRCGFCAIPSFRGQQRSRSPGRILSEVEALEVEEVVLVAQDLASYGRDLGIKGGLIDLVRRISARVARVRLLYLYPASLTDQLIDTVLATGVPYFDLSLQHVSTPLLRRMRRYGRSDLFLRRIEEIRARQPSSAFRSSFILGYPGETEKDHDALLSFLSEAELDWAGFFSYSEEEGTYSAGLFDKVPHDLALERLREASELQDAITFRRRRGLVGEEVRVLVDSPGVARSHREAPEIDGIIRLPTDVAVRRFVDVEVTRADGPDLVAQPLDGASFDGGGARQGLVKV
jgi:ribosomal protein S12 methylthiotransferase